MSLSDYYNYEPLIGKVIEFELRNNITATFTLKSYSEGGCSTGHCSHCAGWLIENVSDEHFDTQHKEAVACGVARDYYDKPIYHEQEANEILSNLLLSNDICKDEDDTSSDL